jgi:hypothetical protein
MRLQDVVYFLKIRIVVDQLRADQMVNAYALPSAGVWPERSCLSDGVQAAA